MDISSDIKYVMESPIMLYEVLMMEHLKTDKNLLSLVCDKYGLPYVDTYEELLEMSQIPRTQIMLGAIEEKDDRVILYSARQNLPQSFIPYVISVLMISDYVDMVKVIISKNITILNKHFFGHTDEQRKINTFLLSKKTPNMVYVLYDAMINGHYKFARQIIKSGISVDEGSYQIALNNDMLEEISEYSKKFFSSFDIKICASKNLKGSMIELIQRGVSIPDDIMTFSIEYGYYDIINILIEMTDAKITSEHVIMAAEYGFSQMASLLSDNIRK